MIASKLLIGAVVAIVAAVSIASLNFETSASAAAQAQPAVAQYVPVKISPILPMRGRHLPGLKLADTHSDICYDNEQQCLRGCDGAQSCSNQCVVNYDGCMSQGG